MKAKGRNQFPAHIEFSRQLRKKQTAEERLLWERLRNRKLGFKFLRQHPIIVPSFREVSTFYIADFFCAEKKLVIEVDGLIYQKQLAYDKARDAAMRELGLTILRITNEEVNESPITVIN